MTINGVSRIAAMAAFDTVSLSGGGGNDTIIIAGRPSFAYPVWIGGGRGTDILDLSLLADEQEVTVGLLGRNVGDGDKDDIWGTGHGYRG